MAIRRLDVDPCGRVGAAQLDRRRGFTPREPVSLNPETRYIDAMKPTVPLADKLDDDTGATEPGYAAWKRAKVERGMEQAKDRAAMIPTKQVLDALKLAR